jgi:hypothetical protein
VYYYNHERCYVSGARLLPAREFTIVDVTFLDPPQICASLSQSKFRRCDSAEREALTAPHPRPVLKKPDSLFRRFKNRSGKSNILQVKQSMAYWLLKIQSLIVSVSEHISLISLSRSLLFECVLNKICSEGGH